MLTFDIQRTELSRAGSTGAVPLHLDVDTGDEALGRAFAQLGSRIYELGAAKQGAQNAIRQSELRLDYQTKTNAALQKLETTFDPDEQQQIISEYQSQVSGLKTGVPDIDNQFTEYRNSTLASNLASFEKTIHRNQIRQLNDLFEINYQKTMETGDRDAAFNLVDSIAASGAVTPEKAEQLKKSWFGNHVLTKAMKYINTGDEGSLAEADKIISTMTTAASKKPEEFTAQQLGKLDDAKSAFFQANRRLRVAKKEGMDAAEKNLVDKMADNTMTLADVKQYRGVFDANTYEKWTKAAQNLDKPGNDLHLAGFKTMAMDVWRGSRSRDDVKAAMLESLADPDGISTTQYAQISGFLDQRVKEVQGQALKRTSMDATRLILGKDSSAMTIDINGNVNFDISKLGLNRQAEFERKMKYVDKCNEALTQLVADNPDMSRRDLYARMNEIKQQYVEAEHSGKMPDIPEERPVNPDPVNYPDAQWSERYGRWIVQRDGQWMAVK